MLVGEHLEGDRPVGDGLQDFPGERRVVDDPRIAHQRGVGGEARHVRQPGHLEHARLFRAVGEELDPKVLYCLHAGSRTPLTSATMRAAASLRSATS